MIKYSFYVGYFDESRKPIRKSKFMIDIDDEIIISRNNFSFERNDGMRFLVLDYECAGINHRQYFKLGYDNLNCEVVRIIADYED